ncbi:energy transducer TonB [Phaeocystidibacter luteus]|uniref:TonB C-terminal domain-containing protein n=1 Tax=Phaeocystidibacter luteus TaxID=911197 RepID=A0A6N6RHI0_9FLAO|nr:hypothetical protein [Phaeocystidibacter luteus]KAB2813763.1 hypothetical protein F8C67_06280 [Phaeocystidibacter luteus]
MARKESSASLERYRVTFFMVGLVLALVAALTTLEWTFIDKEVAVLPPAPRDTDVVTIIPQTYRQQREVPKETNYDQVNDEIFTNYEEPSFVDTKTDLGLGDDDQYAVIEPIPGIDYTIPVDEFALSRLPIYSGCETVSADDRTECMRESLRQQIQEKLKIDDFNVPYTTTVYIEFVVDTQGKISSVQVLRAPSAHIEIQLKEIMMNLPPFMPGQRNGHDQAVKLYLPVRLSR